MHLLVPEVTSPVEAVLLLQAANGERVRRPLRIEPQRKWGVFVVHHSHLDIGYTDLQGTVLRHHRTYLDQALDLAALTDSWPDDAQFRWNIESLLPLERWLATRPEAACEELSERVEAGRFEVCALPFGTHTEALSIDELTRLLRRPMTCARGTPLPDRHRDADRRARGVLGLPRLWPPPGQELRRRAQLGGQRSAVSDRWARAARLFYWSSPGGKRVLVWQTDSPHGVAYLEGNLLGLAELLL